KTEINAHIPLILVGEPAGIKLGGVLEQLIHDMEITCLPNDLPETIEVNVSEMGIGDIISVSDVKLPKGVKTHLADTILLATVAAPRVAEAEEVAEEATADSVVATKQKEEVPAN